MQYAASKANGNGEFYGLDLSPKMIEKAISNNIEKNKKVHFCQGNAEELPFRADYFDAIICTNSFHHYPNPSHVLAEVYRVLKPTGKIFILDLTADGPIMKLVNRRVSKKEKEHVKFYNSWEYREMFADAKIEYLSRNKLGLLNPVKVHIGEKKES